MGPAVFAVHRDGQRATKARRREIQQLPTRRSWQPEPVFDISITHDRYGSSSHPSRTGTSSTHRTLTRLCDLRHGARSMHTGNNTLTIRASSFSLLYVTRHSVCTADFCVFFFYRPTGRPRRASLQLECSEHNSDKFRCRSPAWRRGRFIQKASYEWRKARCFKRQPSQKSNIM